MNKNKNLRLLSMKIIHTKYMQHQKKNADLDIYLLLAIKSGSIRIIIKIEISVSKFL